MARQEVVQEVTVQDLHNGLDRLAAAIRRIKRANFAMHALLETLLEHCCDGRVVAESESLEEWANEIRAVLAAVSP